MEDSRFVDAKRVKAKHLRGYGLEWFARHIDEGYLVDEAVAITAAERDAYAAFAKTCYDDLEHATRALLGGDYREEFGLSRRLWDLARESLTRGDTHVLGRFDVSGVLAGAGPGQLIEFNADTATVLAEAALVQDVQLRSRDTWNDIVCTIADRLREVAAARPPDDRDVLIVTLGGGEDDDNAAVWRLAAEEAGLHADLAHLPSVTFSPGEGVFRQLNKDEWYRYGILVKMIPWDWIDTEEPQLLDDLAALMRDGSIAVVNPPYASLMQSKAMLAELHRRHRDREAYLRAGWGAAPRDGGRYVEKPLFGREGENVSVHEPDGSVSARADGDYAAQPRVWQAFATLPTDSDGDVYQAGVYWAGEPCGIAFRRRDGPIVDEDAEFVSVFVQQPA